MYIVDMVGFYFLFSISAASVYAKYNNLEINNEVDKSTSDSSSDSSSSLEADGNRRSEPQHDGLAIEVTTTTTTTTTTTEATTKVFPPLDKRFRRIYNPDETASVDDYPFMAAVLVNKRLWCGAVIVSKDRVLTAAHCLQLQYNNRFFREYVKMLTVRVGSTNATSGGEVLRVTEISFHPNYKPKTLEFNVALLRLHKDLLLDRSDPRVTMAAYPRDSRITNDANILFLGWGSTLGERGGGQTLLQKVELPIYEFNDCQDIYGRQLVTRSNFCAGYITMAKNVCNHDAGGPAILDGMVVGILSFSSTRCDLPDRPAVFTSVGNVAQWLDSELETASPETNE